jgi:hypothetical protein
MLLVRSYILETDPRVDETIEWQTPTFTYEGNIASFNPRSKDHVSHTARYMSFASLSETRAPKHGIQHVIRARIASKETKSGSGSMAAKAMSGSKPRKIAKRGRTARARQR